MERLQSEDTREYGRNWGKRPNPKEVALESDVKSTITHPN